MSFREFKSDRRCLQSILQQAVLQQAEDVVAMPTFVDFHDVDMDIPEPDPIRPGIAIKVVSHFPLFHGADWKTIEPIKGLFSSVSSDSARHKEYFDPLPVQSSGDLGNESFSNLFLRECSGSLNRNTCDVTTSTASDSMSSSSSNHSFQSTLERSSMHSISSQKQDVDPARQNFQLKQWNDRFCELLRFQKKYGHFNVPHDDSNQQVRADGILLYDDSKSNAAHPLNQSSTFLLSWPSGSSGCDIRISFARRALIPH